MTASETRAAPPNSKAHTAPATGKSDLEVIHHPQGIDLPLVGHVAYRSIGLYAGLAAAGTIGVLEWPVAAAVGATYALVRR